MDENQKKELPYKGMVAENTVQALPKWADVMAAVSNSAVNYPVHDFSKLYKKERDEDELRKALSNFPETRGPEIQYVDPFVVNGSKPAGLLFEEAGMLGRIRDILDHTDKKAGGVEPPALLTAKDMAEELEALPWSFVKAALDPLDTGEADKFLEELKEQGEEFAVVLTRQEEFDWLNLSNMSFMPDSNYPPPQRVNPVIYGTSGMDAHYLSEKSLMFRDPGLFR